jgi:hypothetical protein
MQQPQGFPEFQARLRGLMGSAENTHEEVIYEFADPELRLSSHLVVAAVLLCIPDAASSSLFLFYCLKYFSCSCITHSCELAGLGRGNQDQVLFAARWTTHRYNAQEMIILLTT